MANQLMPVASGPQPGSDRNPADGQTLAKSAREFEAILLQSWLEKMNQSFAGLEQNQDPAHDTLSSLGTQAIAGALAARGGIGIANMILRHLQPGPAGNAPVSGADGNTAPHTGVGIAASLPEGSSRKLGGEH